MIDAASVLEQQLGSVGGGFAQVITEFARAIGPDLSRVVVATSVKGDVLTVRCATASWAQTVMLMERELIQRMGGRLAGKRITRIVARAGAAGAGHDPAPIERPPAPRPQPLPVLDAATSQQLAQLTAHHIADPALRARVLAAATAGHQRLAARASDA